MDTDSDEWIWNECVTNFEQAFADTVSAEQVYADLTKLEMRGDEIDEYIAAFEHLRLGLSTVTVCTVIRAPVIRARARTVWHLKGTCDGTVMGRLRDGYPPYHTVEIRSYTASYGRRPESEIAQIRQDKTISDHVSRP